MSSRKPEVHNISQRRQRRRLSYAYKQQASKSWWILDVSFWRYARERTNTHAHNNAHRNALHPYLYSEVKMPDWRLASDCSVYRRNVVSVHRNKEQCSNNRRNNFFSNRIVNLWNNLPSSTTDFTSFRKSDKSLNDDYLLLYYKLNFTKIVNCFPTHDCIHSLLYTLSVLRAVQLLYIDATCKWPLVLCCLLDWLIDWEDRSCAIVDLCCDTLLSRRLPTFCGYNIMQLRIYDHES